VNKRNLLLSFTLGLVLGVWWLMRLAPQVPATELASGPASEFKLAEDAQHHEQDLNGQAQGHIAVGTTSTILPPGSRSS
jgi:hypothetical protein